MYDLDFWKKNTEFKKYSTSSATGGLWLKEFYRQLSKFFSHCQKPKKVVRAATAPTGISTCEALQVLHLWAVPTSKRYCRDGTSTAVRSAKDLNWALVWSRRKVRTGMIPSGWIRSSSSLKQVTWWKQKWEGHEYKHQQDQTWCWFQQNIQRDTADTKRQQIKGLNNSRTLLGILTVFFSPEQLLWTDNKKVVCSLDPALP